MLWLLVAAFVLAFYWQRHRSVFLRIERQRDAAQVLASAHGLATADVLALRDLVGAAASHDVWQQIVVQFAKRVHHYRAAAATRSPAHTQATEAQSTEAQLEAGQQAEVQPAAAELQAIRVLAPDALAARRFQLLRERFAARR